METKLVEYKDGDRTMIRLLVSGATALIGMKRTLLRGSGIAWAEQMRARLVPVSVPMGGADVPEGETQTAEVAEVAGAKETAGAKGKAERKADPLTTSAKAIMAQVVYPDLVACTIEWEGLDVDALSIDDFLALDERLVGKWETAVYDLNPHWLPGAGADADVDTEAQKKV